MMYERGKTMMQRIKHLENEQPISKPRKVVKFLRENDIIFLSSIYKATRNRPKLFIFYELFERLTPETKRFNFYNVGYKKDFGITADCAYAIINAMEQLGSYVKRDELIFFDKDDYQLFLEDTLGRVDFDFAKNQKYIQDKSVKIKYYKGIWEKKKTIEDIMENYRKANIERNNENELKMKNILDNLKIEYEYQKILKVGCKFYIADFYIPKNNVIIEVDGGYHNSSDMLIKDRERDIALAKYGILTLRFSHNDELFETEAYNVLKNLLVEDDRDK